MSEQLVQDAVSVHGKKQANDESNRTAGILSLVDLVASKR
jgi:hypothetical protein